MAKLPSAALPEPQMDSFAQQWWSHKHQAKLVELANYRDQVDIAFLGDSITQAWEDIANDVRQHYFGSLNCINLGFNGDRTENLLWRLQAQECQHICPKLSVLLIGTNNIGHRKDSPDEVYAGVTAIIEHLDLLWPKSKILLLAIFPRGKRPTNPLRQRVIETNKQLQSFAAHPKVTWLDLSLLFLDDQQRIQENIMSDMLHPNAGQYWRIAEVLQPQVLRLISE